MSSNVILVTGASGFVGSALVKSLCLKGYDVRATVRTGDPSSHAPRDDENASMVTMYNLGELTDKTDWRQALDQVDTIIHCAARAHILRETSANPLETYRQMNTHVTTNLARQASDQGVRRFIFLSSIGVLGHSSYAKPFTDGTKPNPQAPYAQAKWEAEQALHALPTSMDRVIIRPPIVYGLGVRGNFRTLLNAIQKQIPLPLGAVKNKRQFIGIDNLVDFIMTCIEPKEAINDTFLIADKEVISTTQLLHFLSLALGKKARLLPVPHQLLAWGLNSIGKSRLAGQLLGNLEIHSNKAHDLLGWEPPFTMQEQLQQLAGVVA